ncbi:unnamed protein product [Phaeothamnion confervicola]
MMNWMLNKMKYVEYPPAGPRGMTPQVHAQQIYERNEARRREKAAAAAEQAAAAARAAEEQARAEARNRGWRKWIPFGGAGTAGRNAEQQRPAA